MGRKSLTALFLFLCLSTISFDSLGHLRHHTPCPTWGLCAWRGRLASCHSLSSRPRSWLPRRCPCPCRSCFFTSPFEKVVLQGVVGGDPRLGIVVEHPQDQVLELQVV